MRSLKKTLFNVSIPSAAVVVGSVIAVKALSATKVVAGSTAAIGAIKTTTVVTSAGPVVLSVVKASLFTKVFGVLVGASVLCLGSYWIYLELSNKLTNSDLEALESSSKSL